MIPTGGQTVKIIGPEGRSLRGRILNAYRSTGGFLSVWIETEDPSANPANKSAGNCLTEAMVLTERDGVYRDLWDGPWKLEATESA